MSKLMIDDELKPWDMPSGKLSFETRLRREKRLRSRGHKIADYDVCL